MGHLFQVLILVLLSTVNFNTFIFAKDYKGINFQNKLKIQGKSLELNGVGTRYARRFFMNFKVYAAGLYLEKKSQDPVKILKDKTYKRLVMHFFRDVGKESLMDAYRDGLKRNGVNMKKYRKEINDLISRIPDVKKGERIVFTFFKNYFEITHNKTSYALMGREFLEYVLKLWIGDVPNKKLKADILGLKDSDS